MINHDAAERLTATTGCLADGRFGPDECGRDILHWAIACGWPNPGPVVAGSDEFWWDVEMAEEWLNEHVAKDGYSFGWHDGDFVYQSTAWWEEEG